MFNRLDQKGSITEMKYFLQGSLIFFLILYGRIPHQKKKSIEKDMDTPRESFYQLCPQDFRWHALFWNGLHYLQNENEVISIFSNIFINSYHKLVLENRKSINRKFLNLLLLDTKITASQFGRTQYIDKKTIFQGIPLVNISRESKHYAHKNLFRMAHSRVDEDSKSILIIKDNICINISKFENYYKDSYKSIIKNYTEHKTNSPFYNMQSTKSSLFQYFSSSEPPVLTNFYTTAEFNGIKEDDMVIEKDNFETSQLLEAFQIAPSYEILNISNFDQKITFLSNSVFLEGSFISPKTKTKNDGENIILQTKSSSNTEDSTSLAPTPTVYINDNSEYSSSLPANVNYIDESTSSQIFMSSCYVRSSASLESSSISNKEDSTSLAPTPTMYINDNSEYSSSLPANVNYIDESTGSQIFMSSCYVRSSASLESSSISNKEDSTILAPTPTVYINDNSEYSSSLPASVNYIHESTGSQIFMSSCYVHSSVSLESSSISNEEDSTSLSATSAVSINDNSDYSGSSPTSVNEVDEITGSQISMSSYHVHSSASLEASFTGVLHPQSIYSTSPSTDHIVSSSFSSSPTFYDFSYDDI